MTAFYQRLDDDRVRSTPLTRGPWSEHHQHAGPPSALLGSAVAAALGPGRPVRWTFEILRPVPIGDLRVEVEVVRPGRRVALGQGVLHSDDGPVMLVRSWRLRESADGPPADVASAEEQMPGVEQATERAYFPVAWDEGYHAAVDVRFVDGGFMEFGPARAWLRSTVDVVEGEPITPLQRLLVAADIGNGISSRLDLREWIFVNTDLTVHVHDLPDGEWVGLDASTTFGPGGIGQANATVHGGQGPIGHSHQSLLVSRR